MIKNFSRMKKLQDFVDKAEDIYFNPEDIMRLDPDELKKRLESASDVMKNLYEMNRRTISGIKQKGKEEEMDKLKILLSAIPSNKLKDIISSLNKNG
jgi:predicted CopG family antitoxin